MLYIVRTCVNCRGTPPRHSSSSTTTFILASSRLMVYIIKGSLFFLQNILILYPQDTNPQRARLYNSNKGGMITCHPAAPLASACPAYVRQSSNVQQCGSSINGGMGTSPCPQSSTGPSLPPLLSSAPQQLPCQAQPLPKRHQPLQRQLLRRPH